MLSQEDPEDARTNENGRNLSTIRKKAGFLDSLSSSIVRPRSSKSSSTAAGQCKTTTPTTNNPNKQRENYSRISEHDSRFLFFVTPYIEPINNNNYNNDDVSDQIHLVLPLVPGEHDRVRSRPKWILGVNAEGVCDMCLCFMFVSASCVCVCLLVWNRR